MHRDNWITVAKMMRAKNSSGTMAFGEKKLETTPEILRIGKKRISDK